MTVQIEAGARNYEALIGRGLLAQLGARLTSLVRGPRGVVVADENSARLFAAQTLASLHAAGYAPTLITVPAGEGAKSFAQLERVCTEMSAAGLDRTSFVAALGGGVIGDLAGFAAAIYHRGIALVQVPTTLLAQVDSAIGGKTAINLAAGKNLLGAIHQPVLVLADVATLDTLPPREFRQGFAEMVKHAIIADPGMFELLENFQPANLPELIRRNLALKAAIVARDEEDISGQRALLNFGHTVGHAIERAGGYGRFLHGEAVSLGIVAACDVSTEAAGFAEAERARVVAALHAFDLPTRLPEDFPRTQILPALRADKKFERGEIRFVVAEKLGRARLTSAVTHAQIERALARL